MYSMTPRVFFPLPLEYTFSSSPLPRVPRVALSTSPMYTLVGTLKGHGDSITTTQFSPNGVYLASASEDGLLLIHSVGDWKPLLRFVDASPISSLVWHPTLKRLLFCGCKSGDVHMIKFSASGVSFRHIITKSLH